MGQCSPGELEKMHQRREHASSTARQENCRKGEGGRGGRSEGYVGTGSDYPIACHCHTSADCLTDSVVPPSLCGL